MLSFFKLENDMKERILFLTVGTGDKNKLEDSLFAPIRKSMRDGDFTHFILFPSWVTGRNASVICGEQEFRGRVECRKLSEKGMENDADACFAFFDKSIRAVRRQHPDASMTIDLTRGTKAMSAAIYAAGVRNAIFDYRYIYSEQRDAMGRAIVGMEIVGKFNAAYGLYLSLFDQARELFRSGQFAAVPQVLPIENAPAELRPLVKYVNHLAGFFEAWDALDYQNAAFRYKNLPPRPEGDLQGFDRFIPSPEIGKLIDNMAAFPDTIEITAPARLKPLANYAAPVVYDLWANGRRRVLRHQFEDAMLRAYRVTEMIAQVALFSRGYNGENMPQHDDDLDSFLMSKGLTLPVRNGRKLMERQNAIEFLKFLDNAATNWPEHRRFGKKLSELTKADDYFSKRNHSILVHGFVKKNNKKEQELLKRFAEVEAIVTCLVGRANAPQLRKLVTFPEFAK